MNQPNSENKMVLHVISVVCFIHCIYVAWELYLFIYLFASHAINSHFSY